MYRIPFGKTYLDFELPENMRGTYAASRLVEPLADVEKAIDEALADPINSPPLRELAKQGDTVCIVFTDITRNTPEHVLVPALLAELHAAGVRDENITLLCGTGLHRPSTPQEKVIKLGQSIVDRYRVLDHEPFNLAGLEDLGITERGIPLSVNSIALSPTSTPVIQEVPRLSP
jgi:nickel-dependent lactate racemase